MINLDMIKLIIEIASTLIITITSVIILIKLIFKKFDKNKNGKIEIEEISEADLEFCKELLKESIKTIAIGLHKQGGLNVNQINNLMIKEVKNAKDLIEKTIKEGGDK